MNDAEPTDRTSTPGSGRGHAEDQLTHDGPTTAHCGVSAAKREIA